MIIVPILFIIFGIISFVKLVKNPEEKNGLKRVIHQFLGAGIVFFVPLLVNVVMGMLGDGNDISRCWMEASKSEKATYIEIDSGKSRRKIISDAIDYENGLAGLDFSCTSSTVKAQFSCDTLKIVEKHLYDLNAQNFNQVINSYGGFENYAKSLGGIFGEYYGKKIEGRTVADFQRACEYVLGWMYMYGWDYYSGDGANKGSHIKWKGNNAFYSNGGFVGSYISESSTPQYSGDGTNFDHVISGENGGVGRMASACGDLEFFAFNKLGITREKKLLKIKQVRLKELKAGDAVYFWNSNDDRKHNVMVGEVYDDHIVIYDAGSYYTSRQNYKREVYFPKEDTKTADDKAMQSVFGYTSWGIRRWFVFEP